MVRVGVWCSVTHTVSPPVCSSHAIGSVASSIASAISLSSGGHVEGATIHQRAFIAWVRPGDVGVLVPRARLSPVGHCADQIVVVKLDWIESPNEGRELRVDGEVRKRNMMGDGGSCVLMTKG
jgi:hypothetical protein